MVYGVITGPKSAKLEVLYHTTTVVFQDNLNRNLDVSNTTLRFAVRKRLGEIVLGNSIVIHKNSEL